MERDGLPCCLTPHAIAPSPCRAPPCTADFHQVLKEGRACAIIRATKGDEA